MRQTPVDDYLEEISTKLPEELYGRLSDAIYETVCDFDEEVEQLKDENAKLQDENARLRSCLSDDAENARMIMGENAKLRELCAGLYAEMITYSDAPDYNASVWAPKLRELGIEVD